jgi:hypothetical protein
MTPVSSRPARRGRSPQRRAAGGRRPTRCQTGCGEGCVGKPGQLPASYKDQLQSMVSVDED